MIFIAFQIKIVPNGKFCCSEQHELNASRDMFAGELGAIVVAAEVACKILQHFSL